MDKGEGMLRPETMDRLSAVARRRGWTGWTPDAMVFELAGDSLAVYGVVDYSLGGVPMDSKNKGEPEISDAELMRRGLESCPGDPALDALSDEELLAKAAKDRREIEGRRTQRGKPEANPTTSPRGRG